MIRRGKSDNQVYYYLLDSFPIQLFLLHLRRNLFLLLFWIALLSFVTSYAGNLMGVPYLFLDPEYLNEVNWVSMLLVGFALGVFFMAFHMVSYILYAHRYAFLGSVSKPFLRFSLNNSLLPLLFLAVYLSAIIKFQINTEERSFLQIMQLVGGLLLGLNLSIWLIFLYFNFTDQDIFKFIARNFNQQLRKNVISRVNVMQRLESAKRNKRLQRVNYYWHHPLKFLPTPDPDLYDNKLVMRVFDQNHLNAVILQFIIIFTVILLGLLKSYDIIQIPAGASVLLIFAFFVMVIGAITYWLREWAVPVIIVLLLTVNWVVGAGYIDSQYKAFGLNYNTEPAEYNLKTLSNLVSDQNYSSDIDHGINILENWKKKQTEPKPKMIILSVSGGGQRAALWAFHSLARLDSTLEGQLMNKSVLITGASGGLIGASLYRDLYLKHLTQTFNEPAKVYYEKLGKDLLNPIIFSIAVGDNLYSLTRFRYEDKLYAQDRGYAFEERFLRNTDRLMDKKLHDYYEAEYLAQIPMVFINPTVVNDGRKLYLSAQPISYMCKSSIFLSRSNDYKIRGIEFQRMFEKQDAKDLRMMTALRMSATFPYITPNITLPSKPAMEIIDAGMSDNFGISDATRFVHAFRKWIDENTSGVIIISIRDSQKQREVLQKKGQSLMSKLVTPIGSLYSNWDNMQDLNNDTQIEYIDSWMKVPLHLVSFQYYTVWKSEREAFLESTKQSGQKLDEATLQTIQSKEERVSLSWHLTSREKEYLRKGFYDKRNISSLKRVKQILYPQTMP